MIAERKAICGGDPPSRGGRGVSDVEGRTRGEDSNWTDGEALPTPAQRSLACISDMPHGAAGLVLACIASEGVGRVRLSGG